MHILIGIILAVVNLAMLVTVIFGLPGIWLMVAATSLVAWWQWDSHMFSPWTLLAMGLLATAAEIVELLAGVFGAARAGGGWRASLGAMLGGLVGAVAGTFLIPIPLLGTLLGACAGAGLGAWAVQRAIGQPPRPAIAVGLGAGVGRFLGTTAKLAIGVVIWIIATVASFV